MKLNIRQLIERLSLNIDDIILEVFKRDVIVFNSFWNDTDIEKYLKKKVKYFIAHYDSKNYGDKYVLTADVSDIVARPIEKIKKKCLCCDKEIKIFIYEDRDFCDRCFPIVCREVFKIQKPYKIMQTCIKFDSFL